MPPAGPPAIGLVPLLALLAGCAEPGAVRHAPTDPAHGRDTATSVAGTAPGTASAPCPAHMAWIAGDDGGFCIDQYEAGLAGWSPYEVPAGGRAATVAPGQVPQGYISGVAAAEACALAGKRLCTLAEWMRACQGAAGTTYPYGDEEIPGACNTTRSTHPVVELFGASADWSSEQMNDPRLNQLPDTVDPSGANPGCVSEDGVYDLHGNLHEWIDDPAGTFKGGFYVDAVLNGPGCTYTTTAHSVDYHDYSTGFRCCAAPRR